ncbi:non-heme iron oxygenase ferredoxin subunit [Methylobacter sp. BBA5.1]|uniref:non-heme iron oxygenase ferredoxin subunit n=1 Tax=Methylobacter sp. BBA5.1 TaxID=1495064 RepID=UPI000560AC17|nr:non-heme iron oxygenase ferredoxin subunit [Methylobacter sp. BBA5.1]
MSDWIDVIDQNALADGEHIVVDVDGTDVAVFKIEGRFYAIEDVCTHDGAEIASGELDGCEIVCPRHGARFCVKTGAVKAPPAYEDIDTFPVRIENGRVQVRDNRWD